MNSKHRHIITSIILVLALLAQAVVPAGFMPGQSDDGRFELVICTAAGPEIITVPAAHFDPEAGHSDEHHRDDMSACPYGPVVAQSIPVPVMTVMAARFETMRHAPLPPDNFNIAAIIAKPWQSRGPPLS